MAKYGPKPKAPEVYVASLRARLLSRIAVDGNGCHLWLGTKVRDGYGRLKFRTKAVLAHRASWFIHHGEWPSHGSEVCHRCDVPSCVNPKHLFIGSHADNMRDSIRKSRFNPAMNTGKKLTVKKRTHCKRGHEFSPENTYHGKLGRSCRTCMREGWRARHWRERDKRLAYMKRWNQLRRAQQ